MKDNKLEIGTAIVEYSKSGKVIRAFFSPTLKVEVPKDLKDQMQGVVSQTGVKQNADIAIGAWWNKMNEIELADREEFEMVSEVTRCEEWPGKGTVKLCAIKYHFQKRQTVLQ